MNLTNPKKKTRYELSLLLARMSEWPRSNENLESSDSFLFTVHLRSNGHPYPLKPFSRAVAGLNLPLPSVKALVNAMNDSINRSFDQRDAIRAVPRRLLPRPIRSASPPKSLYPVMNMIMNQTSQPSPPLLLPTITNNGLDAVSSASPLMSLYMQRLIDQHKSSFPTTASSSLAVKLQGKRHESTDWTLDFSPSKSTLEALRYSNENMSLGKARTSSSIIMRLNKAETFKAQPPQPPLLPTATSRTLGCNNVVVFKESVIPEGSRDAPSTLSPSSPMLIFVDEVTQNGEENEKEDKKHVNLPSSPLLLGLKNCTPLDSPCPLDSSFTLTSPSLPHERRHVHESRSTSIPCYKNTIGGIETPPVQPCSDLRSEVHLRFEPGSSADKRVFSSPLRQLSSVRRLDSTQVSMSLSPKAFVLNINEERAVTEAFVYQQQVLKCIPVAGLGSESRDARNISHESFFEKKNGGRFFREVGGIDCIGHRRQQQHPTTPSSQTEHGSLVSPTSIKKIEWARMRNESEGVSNVFFSL